MAENKINEVAKLLGLELEEEFKVEGFPHKYKLSENGLVSWSDYWKSWVSSDIIEELLTGESELVKIPKSILDDAEKEYLSNVIKPFSDRIIYIVKHDYTPGEYIEMYLRHYDDGCSGYSIVLPYFKKGTMYKGMEISKEYTLYELGL